MLGMKFFGYVALPGALVALLFAALLGFRLDRAVLVVGFALLIVFFLAQRVQKKIDDRHKRREELGLPPLEERKSWYWFAGMVAAFIAGTSAFDGLLLAGLITAGVVLGAWIAIDAKAARDTRHEEAEAERGAVWRKLKSEYRNAFTTVPWAAAEKAFKEGASADEIERLILQSLYAPTGVTLGNHRAFAGSDKPVPVRIAQDQRERHIYVIGKTGSGKTNLLQTLILQDLEAGNGFAVIAADQSLITEKILPFIPSSRLDDVIYVDPGDEKNPVPINPVHLDPGENIDLRVEENLELFQRLLDVPGPQTEDILRHTLYALLERPASTLEDVDPLLHPDDSPLREEVVRTSQLPHVVKFFRDTYPATFPRNARNPITTRLRALTTPKPANNVLCNPHQSLNLRRVMDEGRIALFNVSEGVVGERTSQLLGQLVVSKIQMAALSRADMPEKDRRFFTAYVDEFQTFTTRSATSFETLISRARQYKVGLVLAHQTSAQLSNQLFKVVLGAGTKICFQVSYDDALRFTGEFAKEVEATTLSKLDVGEAYAKIIGTGTFHLDVPLAVLNADPDRARLAIERSRANWGAPDPPAFIHGLGENSGVAALFSRLLSSPSTGDSSAVRAPSTKPKEPREGKPPTDPSDVY